MNLSLSILVAFAMCLSTNAIFGQTKVADELAPNFRVLDNAQVNKLDTAADRGLEWLAKQQKADGSFKSIEIGQPGVTAFCVMAFLAQGKTPSDREYGPAISKAIDFICAQQKRNGLIAAVAPNAAPIPRVPTRTARRNPARCLQPCDRCLDFVRSVWRMRTGTGGQGHESD